MIGVKKDSNSDITFLQFCRILISLVSVKYFAWDCRRKQFFGRNLAQCPSQLNFRMFSLSANHFFNYHVNIKPVSSLKSFKFNDWLLALFCIIGLSQNLTLQNFELCSLVFWSNYPSWAKNDTFSRKLIHHWKKKEQKKKFRQFSSYFWQFLLILVKSESPQIKRYLISSIINFTPWKTTFS